MSLISNLPSGGSVSEKHTNREMKFDYKEGLNGETEVLSLTGKGRLYSCWLRDTFVGTHDVKLQIVVDGKTILNVASENNTSNSKTKHITVGNIGMLSPSEINGSSVSPKLVGLSADLQTVSTGTENNVWVLLEDYISFNESLVITVVTVSTNGVCSTIYSLDN